MIFRVFAYLIYFVFDSLKIKALIHVLLGIRIDSDSVAEVFYLLDPDQKVPHIFYRLVRNRTEQFHCLSVKVFGNQDSQFEFFAILNMNTDIFDLIRRILDRLVESFFDLFKCVQDMFAGTERIFPKIRTGAIRIASLPTPQCDPVCFSRRRIGNCIIRPELIAVDGSQFHLLAFCPCDPVCNSLLYEFLVAEAFHRYPLRRRCGKAQCQFLLKYQRKCRSHMRTCRSTCRAVEMQTLVLFGPQTDSDNGIMQTQPEKVVFQDYLFRNVNLVFSTCPD